MFVESSLAVWQDAEEGGFVLKKKGKKGKKKRKRGLCSSFQVCFEILINYESLGPS
jgi:hypothetical protein